MGRGKGGRSGKHSGHHATVTLVSRSEQIPLLAIAERVGCCDEETDGNFFLALRDVAYCATAFPFPLFSFSLGYRGVNDLPLVWDGHHMAILYIFPLGFLFAWVGLWTCDIETLNAEMRWGGRCVAFLLLFFYYFIGIFSFHLSKDSLHLTSRPRRYFGLSGASKKY